MLKQVARALIALFGVGLGIGLVALVYSILGYFNIADINLLYPWANLLIYVIAALATGFIFFILSIRIINATEIIKKRLDQLMENIPTMDILFGSIGLIVGLIIAALICILYNSLPVGIRIVLNLITYLLFAYLGISIAIKRRAELPLGKSFKRGEKREQKSSRAMTPKVLDTSVIIDGRIFDICKTGIVEGNIIIPQFILQELRHIADSSDALKRNRGRRGLDILNKIQQELDMRVIVMDKDFDDVAEVDAKLLKLAHQLKGKVVTNDYNLNKVAMVQGVQILNINELANALKPVVLPGEEMNLTIVKPGKESGQGVAYLDDGTMIVVEGGKPFLGELVSVLVTSVLQTSAGRMIFAKLKSDTA